MEQFAIKYTEEITEELFNKLLQHLLSLGNIKGTDWVKKDWSYGSFKEGGWLRTKTTDVKRLAIDTEKMSCHKEKSIWDFIKKEEAPTDKEYKIGDWCYIIDRGSSQLETGGVYQINEITVNLHFDIDGTNKKNNSCWVLKKDVRLARPEEIPAVREQCPFKAGDWVWNSEDGVMQIKEVHPLERTFSAFDKREERLYYTTNTEAKGDLYYTRHALPHEIPETIKPKAMETFKIGDYVEITKSSNNWASEMDQYVGRVVELISTEGSNRFRIKEDGGRWIWVYGDGHFKRASAPVHSLLEEAKKRYPKGTNYKCASNPEYSHVVEIPGCFSEPSSDIIHGERGKGCLYYKGKWAEIVKEEALPIEEARRRFPEGIQFNNGNLLGFSMNTYVSSGSFTESGRDILVTAINGPQYTIYKGGKWANVVKEDKYEKINRLFPIGAVFISPENGREYTRCSGTPWTGNGDDVLVSTAGGCGQYVKFGGRYATLAPPRYAAESDSYCSSPGVERMPAEIAMKKKPVKRRQLM